MGYDAGSFQVAVIGAGHAGIEAALAAARLGCETVIFTINMDAVGNCPCNPSIGGTAKGHLVREIDALGGEMGKTTDECFLQSRMLNLGKGPAVHSLRAQIDRRKYSEIMKHKLELQEHLQMKQAEVTGLEQTADGRWKVTTRMNAEYLADTVILATGTFLGGRIFIGEVSYESGPDGLFPATFLSESLNKLGLRLRRFKTGTPARVLRSSIDFTDLEVQAGDEPVTPFSYETEGELQNKEVCYVSWTNDRTKKVIMDNIHRSPLYSGMIEGVGPRYCPSIEDKVVRFADKPRHQLFIEPCGENTEEMYLQGMSSSLPEEVQIAFYHTIKGLENVQIMRSAYAIEYDCVDPTQMEATLEFADLPGLYGAGQFNGSSGYEEAAAQGLVAGINAARKVRGLSPMILDRASSYIGTLVDDLITKGVSDPYRMMTSRSEYRLVLRQDNADERLTPIGREYGLVQDDRWEIFCRDQQIKQEELQRLEQTRVPLAALRAAAEAAGQDPARLGESGGTAAELLRRPGVSYELIAAVIGRGAGVSPAMALRIETEIRYAGYIAREQRTIREVQRHENVRIPAGFDYAGIHTITLEAREKLAKIRPRTLAQAGRIPGVSPSDLAQLSLAVLRHDKEENP